MRFWSRKEGVRSGQVKPTQPHQRNHKQFDLPTIRARRAFSSLLEDGGEMEKIPSIASMDIHPSEPIDPTRGGQDEVPHNTSGVGLPSYTITNLTEDRAYNVNATTTAELGRVLGTLIGDISQALRELSRRSRA